MSRFLKLAFLSLTPNQRFVLFFLGVGAASLTLFLKTEPSVVNRFIFGFFIVVATYGCILFLLPEYVYRNRIRRASLYVASGITLAYMGLAGPVEKIATTVLSQALGIPLTVDSNVDKYLSTLVVICIWLITLL